MPDADDIIKITIDGRDLELDPADLELGEVELLEDTMDTSIDQIDFGRAKAMRVLVYILVHRTDRTFTMEDAAHIKLSSLAAPNGNGATDEKPKRPTKAAKSGS